MKSIVFMVNTEYHLLMAIGIINQYFRDNYRLIIYRVSPIKGTRLNNVGFADTNIEYYEILYDYTRPNPDLKIRLNEIVNLNPDVFFFFLENKFWENYLLSKLKKQGAKIILGPDGMKAYNDRILPKGRVIKNYILGWKYCLEARILYPPFVEKNYATSKYIDEVWVEYTSKYNNLTNKRVVEFSVSFDISTLQRLNKIFLVEEAAFSLLNKKAILFLDSSISSKEYYNKTVSILKFLQDKFPDRVLAIKLHQQSNNKAKVEYGCLKNVNFLESNYPAELYIANAKDCIVVSLISTSLLFYNHNCKYYWTYPLFENIVDYSGINNPTRHIKVISNVSEILA